jgi:hypothetical protein
LLKLSFDLLSDTIHLRSGENKIIYRETTNGYSQ